MIYFYILNKVARDEIIDFIFDASKTFIKYAQNEKKKIENQS